MRQENQIIALSAALILGAVAEPVLAEPGLTHKTSYEVLIDAGNFDGNPIDGSFALFTFAYGGCCQLDISNQQLGHKYGELGFPIFDRFDPIDQPPWDSPRPCVGGVGHCSAFDRMWDRMGVAEGQFIDAHVAALPANMGSWSFNGYGTYQLKPGDTSSFRFRLDTGYGIFEGDGHVLSVRNTVPEPATWGMMIAGFGLIGVVMRRRAHLAAQRLAGSGQCGA